MTVCSASLSELTIDSVPSVVVPMTESVCTWIEKAGGWTATDGACSVCMRCIDDAPRPLKGFASIS